MMAALDHKEPLPREAEEGIEEEGEGSASST